MFMLLLMLMALTGHVSCWNGPLDEEKAWIDCVNSPSSCTVLELGHQQLRSTIPDSISTLTGLTSLDLGINFLNGTIPAGIVALTSLTSLSINSNALTGTIPDGLSSWTDCRSMRFDNNMLSGTLPPDLGTITALTELTVCGNSNLCGDVAASLLGLSTYWICNNGATFGTGIGSECSPPAPEFYDSCLVRMKWLEISDLPSMSFAEKRTAVMDSFAQVSNYTVVDLQELDSSELWEVACTDIFDSCLVARELGSAAEVRAMDFDAKRVLLIDEYVRETSIPASQVRALDRSSLWDAACIAPPIQLDPSRATQSSNYKIYSASLAADGNNSTQFTDGSCSHTKNELSWWSIDLGGNYSIQGVAITNRMDKTSGRLNDFDIRVGMHPGYSANNEACKEGLPTPAGARQMYACDYLRGRYVSINMNQNNFLQLCEVEVYAFLLSERSALTAAPTEASTNTPTQSPTIPLTESPSRSPTLPKVPHPNSENTDVLEFWKDGLDNSIQFLLNPHHTTPEVDHSAPDGSRVSRIKVIGSNRDKAVLMAHVLKKTEISENLGEIRTEF